jgi:hypothetical protein
VARELYEYFLQIGLVALFGSLGDHINTLGSSGGYFKNGWQYGGLFYIYP